MTQLDPKRYWSGKRGEGEAVKWLRDHADYDGDECLIFPFYLNPDTSR